MESLLGYKVFDIYSHPFLPPSLWNVGLTFVIMYIVQRFFKKDFSQSSQSSPQVDKKDVINTIRRRRKTDNLPPPYPTGWFGLCTSSSLKPGSVKEIYAFGQDLVVWRGTSGQAFVADGYCPHLGAHLGVGGSVSGDCITCPFHNWSFNGSNDGNCASAPNNSSTLPNVRLKMWHTTEINDLILVWNPDPGTSEEASLPSWEVPQFLGISPGNRFGVLETSVYTHVEDIAENGADFSHVKTLHSTLAKVSPWILAALDLKEVWHPSFQPGQDSTRHEARYEVEYHLEAFGGRLTFGGSTFLGKQYGPGLFLYEMTTPLGKLFITEAVTPVEELHSGIILQFYRQPGNLMARFWGSTLMRMYISDFNKDVAIWNRKCSLRTPILVGSDSTIKAFRRYYSQFYETTN